MAGQWAGAPADEAEGHADVPGPRRAPVEWTAGRRPAGRRQAEGRRAPQAPARAAGQGGERRPASRVQARRATGAARPSKAAAARRARGTGLTLTVLLPVFGALVDELIGAGPGWTFAVLTVLGTAGAALVSSPAGWWWVLTAPPPVVLLATAASQLLADSSKYQDGKTLATEALRWAIHGFPVMAWAIAAGLAVVLTRFARESGGLGG